MKPLNIHELDDVERALLTLTKVFDLGATGKKKKAAGERLGTFVLRPAERPHVAPAENSNVSPGARRRER